jgi:lipid-A-disaccharide synthase-like uncharacterized protein
MLGFDPQLATTRRFFVQFIYRRAKSEGGNIQLSLVKLDCFASLAMTVERER